MSTEFNPVLQKDFYKAGHKAQYFKGTSTVYSNFTPRGTRREPKPAGVIWFGLQAWIEDYLIRQFNDNFFNEPKGDVVGEYQEVMDACLGPGMDCSHIGALHDLGYLPLIIKSLPEGTLVPYRVPALTIRNTRPDFFWLTNMIETVMSNSLWLPSTSATTAFGYRKVFDKYAKATGADPTFVQWQGHDFSMRGMEGTWASALSGAGHLLSFSGTDTIPAILALRDHYGADYKRGLVGGSVMATEHAVTCVGSAVTSEIEYLNWLITVVKPSGIISLVSDTWDLWRVLTEYLPKLKDTILARDGKVVIRPDSGDPANILCGDSNAPEGSPAYKGVINLLWDVFGGKINDQGFRELNQHIGAIYGDSISPERQIEILSRLKAMGYASSNIVLGIGSYTYQHVTRDTDGWAMKATYAEVDGKPYNISKDPVTDDGTKKSASGLLRVDAAYNGGFTVQENCSWAEESGGELKVVFEDGDQDNLQNFGDVKRKVESYL